MNTLLRITLLPALSALLTALPASADSMPDVGPVLETELSEVCTRKSRRPINEEISGRCTEEKGKHYFVNSLPACDCTLETDGEGLAVLRLALPEATVAALEQHVAVPAVFRRDQGEFSGVAHIL